MNNFNYSEFLLPLLMLILQPWIFLRSMMLDDAYWPHETLAQM
jgi:hypothetical protein